MIEATSVNGHTEWDTQSSNAVLPSWDVWTVSLRWTKNGTHEEDIYIHNFFQDLWLLKNTVI